MKKIITSAGLIALSTAGMQAAYAPGLGQIESSKLLTYSLSLRGFYDDNITTTASALSTVQSSTGFDLRPSISLNLTSLQQTYIGATYTYGLRYYADRKPHRGDHSHEFDTKLEHAFTEKDKLNVDDQFSYAQEPEVVGDLGVLTRSPSSVYHNNARIGYTTQFTELIGAKFSYENGWFDYLQTGVASRAATLNRFEHQLRGDSTWTLDTKLVARGGYIFKLTDYTGSEDISTALAGIQKGSVRNRVQHTVFAGADYTVNARLRASVEAGAQFSVFDNPLAGKDLVSPYVNASATYVYREHSYAQIGATVDRAATDVVGFNNASGNLTSDTQTISPYISISHRITPSLTATALGRYQRLSYNGGAFDKLGEDFFITQLNFDYRISQHWVTTLTYNYDKLNSDRGIDFRAYSRNRVFLGFTATY